MPHRAAQLIRLSGREARSLDGQAHALLLKERYAQRALEHGLQLWMGVRDRFCAAAAANVRMHHVALNRARTNDGDLHDDVVKTPRSQTRQGRHLCARFNLKKSHRIGFAQHVVDAFVIASAQVGKIDLRAAAPLDVGEREFDGVEHTEA